MNELQVLKMLRELWADVHDPSFVWQAIALFACLAVAASLARWWRKREAGKAGRLHAAGTRVAFPLLALVLVTTAHEALAGLIHVNILAVAMPLFSSLAMVRACVYVLRQSFPQAAWLGASERWVAAFVWVWLALYITGFAPAVVAALDRFELTVGKHPLTLWMVLKGGFTVIVTLMVALWLSGVLERRLGGLEALDSSLRIVMVRLSKALLIVVALMVGLTLVGIDMTALSVFTGALGVGLGLGLQKIASNYVSGFIILLDRSIRIGDGIQVTPEATGTVTEITTRYTVLRNPTGTEFIVPNETLISNIVQNQSYSDSRVRLAVRVGVAYDTPDLEATLGLLEEIARAHPRVLADPPVKALVVNFGDSVIDLEVGFWIPDPQAGSGGIRSDISLAIWKAFRERGISR